MRCEDARADLAAALSGSLDSSEATALRTHVASCRECGREEVEMRDTWHALEAWPGEEPPELLAEAVRRQILTDLAVHPVPSLFSPARLVLGGALGLVLLVLALAFLPEGVALADVPAAVLASCSVFWLLAFALASLLLFTPARPIPSVEWRRVGLVGLAAMGVATILTRSCSVATIVQAMGGTTWGESMVQGGGVVTVYFALGAAYAFLPLLAAHALFRSRRGIAPFKEGVASGALLFALLLPSILLQCAPFSLGVVVSWIVGTIAGSVLGGPPASWLSARASAAAA